MPEANGEISNEFFKKLNQQIVQKDNLIKLLQLQIKNLKNQIEQNGADSDRMADLQDALDDKIKEFDALQAELAEQRQQSAAFAAQKDEEIRSLNQMLEEKSQTVADDNNPKIAELEEQLRNTQSELATTKTDLENAKNDLATAKSNLENASVHGSGLDEANAKLQKQYEATVQELNDTKEMLETQSAELNEKTEELYMLQTQLSTVGNKNTDVDEAVAKAVAEANEKNQDAINKAALEVESYKSQIAELQQNITDLKNEATANEVNSASSSEEIKNIQIENERLSGEVARLGAIEDEFKRLKADQNQASELAIKLSVVEAERSKLAEELEAAKTAGDEEMKKEFMLRIAQLENKVSDKDDQLANLRRALEAKGDDSVSDPESRHEIEMLTNQVADQLLSIQNFENMVKQTREALAEKESEVELLKQRLAKTTPDLNNNNSVIPVDGESDVISSFIDFFDGLDAALQKRQDPELQALHQKLMDRLIVPNKITYTQVISETFDQDKHFATDYFRSDKFPERCIVFEVEKGYRKGDTVIKKSKVWVVQNLFTCNSCGVEQTNPDSRFCHLCGAKIVAPNGLPVDSLPVFEPTANTYHKFSERMLDKGDLEKAKEYIAAGLELDKNYVPLNISMADLLTQESKFEEAMAYLKHAYEIKPDTRTKEKIDNIETKLNIYAQAKNLNLSPEELDKLLHIIQK